MIIEKIDGELYEYTYEELLKFYNGNKDIIDKIYTEIQFCRTMHELRTQQWECRIANESNK